MKPVACVLAATAVLSGIAGSGAGSAGAKESCSWEIERYAPGQPWTWQADVGSSSRRARHERLEKEQLALHFFPRSASTLRDACRGSGIVTAPARFSVPISISVVDDGIKRLSLSAHLRVPDVDEGTYLGFVCRSSCNDPIWRVSPVGLRVISTGRQITRLERRVEHFHARLRARMRREASLRDVLDSLAADRISHLQVMLDRTVRDVAALRDHDAAVRTIFVVAGGLAVVIVGGLLGVKDQERR